jgi:hypothetical protein
LARKRAIIEAVVSEIDANISRFHTILGIRRGNFVAAVERLRSIGTDASLRFSIPRKKDRAGSIPSEVQSIVILWWTQETRVSPNRKDIRRKRLGRRSYDEHPTHLLLETQVPSSEPLLCNFRIPFVQ